MILLLAPVLALAFAAQANAAFKPYSIVVCAYGADEACTAPANDAAAVQIGATGVPMTAMYVNHNKPGSGINLGSSNLSAPAGFTITTASVGGGPALPSCTPATTTNCLSNGTTVQLRSLGLAPNSGVTVSMTVNTPSPPTTCTVQAPCNWGVQSKQSNDFSGSPGNNLNVDSTSNLGTIFATLQFADVGQPPVAVGDAQLLTPITNSSYTPSPPAGPVSVDAVDANGAVAGAFQGPVSLQLTTPNNTNTNPNPSTLGGTNPKNASGGVASFSDLTVNLPGIGYILSASSGDLLPLPSSVSSNMFNIAQAGTQCASNKACNKLDVSTDFGKEGGIDATVTATSGQQTPLAESLDFGNPLTPGQCEGYQANHQVFWDLNSFSGRIATISITTTTLLPVSGSAIKGQDNCLSAPKEFTEINDATKPPSLAPAPGGPGFPAFNQPDGTPGFSGLLPDCGKKSNQVDPSTNPCVVSRSGVSNPLGGGTLTIVISVPAILGDMTSRG
jgi:hypothetical protein